MTTKGNTMTKENTIKGVVYTMLVIFIVPVIAFTTACIQIGEGRGEMKTEVVHIKEEQKTFVKKDVFEVVVKNFTTQQKEIKDDVRYIRENFENKENK